MIILMVLYIVDYSFVSVLLYSFKEVLHMLFNVMCICLFVMEFI